MPPPRPSARPPASRGPHPWRRPAMVLAVALALLVAYSWWGRGRTAPPALDRTRDTVVFLGDSITSGHGLPLEVTFPHRLGVLLALRTHNAGISGDRTAGGLARLERDVLAHRPRLVVVELGANDVFGRLPGEQTIANVRSIARRLRQDGAGVLLLHIQIPQFGSDPLRDGFRRIAREEGAWLVEDFLDGVVPGLTTDGLHPSEEGHARLAARLEPTLRDILR